MTDEINPWRRRTPSTASTLAPDSQSALGSGAQDLQGLGISSSGPGSSPSTGPDSGLVLPPVVDPPLDVRLHRIEMAITMLVASVRCIEMLIREGPR